MDNVEIKNATVDSHEALRDLVTQITPEAVSKGKVILELYIIGVDPVAIMLAGFLPHKLGAVAVMNLTLWLTDIHETGKPLTDGEVNFWSGSSTTVRNIWRILGSRK